MELHVIHRSTKLAYLFAQRIVLLHWIFLGIVPHLLCELEDVNIISAWMEAHQKSIPATQWQFQFLQHSFKCFWQFGVSSMRILSMQTFAFNVRIKIVLIKPTRANLYGRTRKQPHAKCENRSLDDRHRKPEWLAWLLILWMLNAKLIRILCICVIVVFKKIASECERAGHICEWSIEFRRS